MDRMAEDKPIKSATSAHQDGDGNGPAARGSIEKSTGESRAPGGLALGGGQSVMIRALIMAFGTLTSRVLGLVREILFAALFPRIVTDSWYAAFKVPNIFRRLFGEGSLSVSFIPVFVDARLHSERRAQNLVNSFYTLFLILLAMLTGLGIIFTEPMFRLLLDETFLSVPGKFELTVNMGRIMFGYIFLVCTYAYYMAILNGLGKFGWAAMAPTFFNIVMVASTVLPQGWFRWEGEALAWGVIVGGVVQAGILIPSLMAYGYFPKLGWDFWQHDVLRVLKSMGPGLIGMSILQVTTLANMVFASSLGEGALSYLNLADRLMELPLSLVSVSIGSALLPTLSAFRSKGQAAEATAATDQYFRVNLFVCFPAAVGLFVLARPIVELLFERGKFLPHETLIVAEVIRIYAVNMIFISCIRVYVPSFYAVKNTWLPAVASVLALTVHLFLAPILKAEWGLRGLNVSSLVSAIVNFTVLVLAYRAMIGRFPWSNTFRSFGRWIVPLAGLFAVLQSYDWVRFQLGDSLVAKVVCLLGLIFVGIAVYGVFCRLLRVSEFEYVFAGFLRRLKKRTAKRLS